MRKELQKGHRNFSEPKMTSRKLLFLSEKNQKIIIELTAHLEASFWENCFQLLGSKKRDIFSLDVNRLETTLLSLGAV